MISLYEPADNAGNKLVEVHYTEADGGNGYAETRFSINQGYEFVGLAYSLDGTNYSNINSFTEYDEDIDKNYITINGINGCFKLKVLTNKIVTIADILAKAENDFPTFSWPLPNNVWVNANCSTSKMYIANNGLTFGGQSLYNILTASVTKVEDNFEYNHSTGIKITFVMNSEKLVKITIEGSEAADNNGNYLPPAHTHAFIYTANNDVITATCIDGCSDGFDDDPLTLALTPPTSLVYDGSAKEVSFAAGEADAWEAAGLELPTITYTAKSGSSLTSDKAVDAGSYTASVTVDTDKTASLDFEITKATPYIKTTPAPNEITYGQALSVSTLSDWRVQISSTDSREIVGWCVWTNETIRPSVSDSNSTEYGVTFTPSSEYEKNYTTATCTVKLRVNKADYTDVTTTVSADLKATSGSTVEITLPAIPSGASYGTVTKTMEGDPYTLSDISDGKITATSSGITAEGNMTFNVAVNPDGNHNGYTITVTLTPVFTYTVTFEMNGHGTQVDPQTVEAGNKATKPSDPTAEVWTFGGWYEDATFNVTFDFDSAIDANTTIYAKWTKNTPAPSGDSTPTVTVPVTGDENSVKVSATVSGSTATVKPIKDADLAKVTGGESVEIDLTGLKKDVDTAKIPTATVEKIGEQAGMSVKLATATVSFDKTATQEISDQAKGNTVELVVDDIKEE